MKVPAGATFHLSTTLFCPEAGNIDGKQLIDKQSKIGRKHCQVFPVEKSPPITQFNQRSRKNEINYTKRVQEISLKMELATLANQPNSNNQQQLQMQSSNSAATESQNFDGCLQNQTSQTISVTNNTLPSPLTVPSTEVVTTFANDSSTNVNDRNMSEEGYQNSGKSLREMRELDREKLMRYVYFGQAALVIIVALAWIAFTIFDLDSEKANENATRNEFANATQNKSFILPALINNTTNSNRKPLPSVPVDDRISNSTPLKVPLMVNNGIDYPINGDF